MRNLHFSWVKKKKGCKATGDCDENHRLRGRRPRGGAQEGTRSGSEPDREVEKKGKQEESNLASSGVGGKDSNAERERGEVTAFRDAATSPMATASSWCGRERTAKARNGSLQTGGKMSMNPLLLPPKRKCRGPQSPMGKS